MNLAVVSMLLLSAVALDDDPRFAQACASFQALDYEAALSSFDQLANEGRAAHETARLLTWSGATRALLGDEMAAKLVFDSALRLKPDVALEMRTSPKVHALFDDAKQRAQAAAAAVMPAVEAEKADPQPVAQPGAQPVAGPGAPSSNGEPTPKPTPTPPTAASNTGAPLVLWLGAGAGFVLGGGASVIAVLMGLSAASRAGEANADSTPQKEVPSLVQAANQDVVLSIATAGAAVALAAVATTLIVVAATWSSPDASETP